MSELPPQQRDPMFYTRQQSPFTPSAMSSGMNVDKLTKLSQDLDNKLANLAAEIRYQQARTHRLLDRTIFYACFGILLGALVAFLVSYYVPHLSRPWVGFVLGVPSGSLGSLLGIRLAQRQRRTDQ